jgi:hypothetical protein
MNFTLQPGEKAPPLSLMGTDKKIYSARDNPLHSEQSKSEDMKKTLEKYYAKKPIVHLLTTPIGCNVKWEKKPPHWMPPKACDQV